MFGSVWTYFWRFWFFSILVRPCSACSGCPIIETLQNLQKTSKIRKNSSFLHHNAPNSCQKVLETPFSSVLIIFLSFAIDSWRLLGPKNGINSILRFSWFFDLKKCLDAEFSRFWEPKWNSIFRDLRKMRFKKPRKTFFDPKIALVHQKCARFS